MRSVPEWIGKHDDEQIPPRVRLRVFERFHGICPKCTRKLMPGHWTCDHIIALANRGKHRESNLQPLCNDPCNARKNKDDVAEKSKTYQRRSRHVGVGRLRKTIPGKRFDGSPIPSKWVVR